MDASCNAVEYASRRSRDSSRSTTGGLTTPFRRRQTVLLAVASLGRHMSTSADGASAGSAAAAAAQAEHAVGPDAIEAAADAAMIAAGTADQVWFGP